MRYEGSLGMSVSAEIAELKKQFEEFKLKATGKCGSTRASDRMVQTGIVLLLRIFFLFPVSFRSLLTKFIRQLPSNGDTVCV